MKAFYISPAVKAFALGGLVGGFTLAWYLRPYPWLGVGMGLAAWSLTTSILLTGRIERWRRVLFIGISILGSLTLLLYALHLGYWGFRQYIATWDASYFFPGTSGVGTMPFPTPVVMPSIFWGGANFLGQFGVWQTPIPVSFVTFFLFMIPVMLLFAVFGRGLCGWLCPLGGLPELAAAIGKDLRGLSFLKDSRVSAGGVSYKVLKPWVHMLRYGVLAGIFIISIPTGFAVVNIFYPVLWLKSTVVFLIVAGVLLIFAIGLPLMTKRRWWCYICPVGAVLSLVERITLFRIKIDQKKCVKCLDCVRACRYYALTPESVEAGRYLGIYCVRCGRCVEACSEEAIDITLLGSLRRAREPFVAVLIGLAFAFYAWFAIQFVYLASKLSEY